MTDDKSTPSAKKDTKVIVEPNPYVDPTIRTMDTKSFNPPLKERVDSTIYTKEELSSRDSRKINKFK